MTCHVDEKQTKEVYANCVLEYDKPEDCSHAKKIKSPKQCEFWKPKEIKRRDFVIELEALASSLYPSVMGEVAQDAANYIRQLLTEIQSLERVNCSISGKHL